MANYNYGLELMAWAGGDSWGKQSAALLVVREGGGYGGDNDRAVDLRVDDHPDPIVADVLRRRGYVQEQDIEDDDLLDALSAYIRTENFKEREQRLSRPAVLEYTKGQS